MARQILELNPLGHCQYCLQGPTQIFKSGGVGGCGLRAGTTQHTLDRGGLRTQALPGHLSSDRKHVSLSCEVGSQVKGPWRPSPSPSWPHASTSMWWPGAKRKCLTSAQCTGGRSSGGRGPGKARGSSRTRQGLATQLAYWDQRVTLMTQTLGTSRPKAANTSTLQQPGWSWGRSSPATPTFPRGRQGGVPDNPLPVFHRQDHPTLSLSPGPSWFLAGLSPSCPSIQGPQPLERTW